MARLHVPETASELVTMLHDQQIDIFDALELAPMLVDDKRGMSRLKNRIRRRERARILEEQSTVEGRGDNDVEQCEE